MDKVSNVLQVYQSCSSYEVDENKDWYMRARAWCEHRAQMYGIEVRTVAAVISALSPRNKWERNLVDADALLHGVMNGYGCNWITTGTFMKNVEKAWDIAKYGKPELAETGDKTRAFLNCIDNPLCDDVVVDVWAMRVVLGDIKAKVRGMNTQEYNGYAQAYRCAGREVNLRPMQIQAVTWCAVRNRSKRHASVNQMSMF